MSENLSGDQPEQKPAPSAQPAPAPSAPTAPAAPYAGAPAPGYGAPQPKGLALSSMIVGIVSLLLAWPVSIIGIIGGIVALVLGIIGRKKGQPKGMALTGIITGALAIVLGIIAIVVVAMFVGAALNDPYLQEQLQDLE